MNEKVLTSKKETEALKTMRDMLHVAERSGCLVTLTVSQCREVIAEMESTPETSAGQLRASEWAAENNAAVTDEWMRGWDACLVANRIPLATGSLLRPASTQAPPGCYCTDRCAAPVVMGRQTPCRDPEKAARFAQETPAVRAGVSVKDPTPPQDIVLCAAMGPSGFICERPKGHSGRHRDGDNTPWDAEKAPEPALDDNSIALRRECGIPTDNL